MKQDLRSFHYSHEPARRRERWRLDALQASLQGIHRVLASAQAEVERLRGLCAAQSALSAGPRSRSIDPNSQALLLLWLAGLRRRIGAAEGEVAEIRAEQERIAWRWRLQQRKVDAIERHREDCAAEFVREERARRYSEADREWLARLNWDQEYFEGAREIPEMPR